MAKQHNRSRKEPSPTKKVSDVEAAYVVQSYLTEKQFSKTLAEFRCEAAPILASLKTSPPAVRSLTTILNDFVTLREKQQGLFDDKSRLEQCLKETQMIIHQERTRMNSFVQGVHESLAVYQTGHIPHDSPALPSMSSTPTQSATMYQVGHHSPLGVDKELVRTQSSARALHSNSISNKRKIVVNKTTPPEALRSYSPTTSIAASKKARQTSGSVQGGQESSLWMCGTVRKNSLNLVRPVVPILPQETRVSNSGSKVQQSAQLAPSMILTRLKSSSPQATCSREPTPLPTFQTLDGSNQQHQSSAPELNSIEIGAADTGNGQDPQTPPRVLATVGSPQQASTRLPPLEASPPIQPSNNRPLISDSCATQSALEELSSQQPGEGGSADGLMDSSSQCTPESCNSQRTRDSFQFKKVPSKTMRPLHFNDSAPSEHPASPSSQWSPSELSAAPSDCGASVGLQVGESSEHSAADLDLIDDILASLDDASFPDLVGDMLGTDEITLNDLVPNTQSYGDVDFSNIQNVTNRPFIGEDSFGFHLDGSVSGSVAPALGKQEEVPGSAVKDNTCQISSNEPESSALRPAGVLTERDPNLISSGDRPTKSSTVRRSSPKRETKAKYAFGQENTSVGGSVAVGECANVLCVLN